MYCNKCGFNNDEGYTFCGHCGAPLASPNNQFGNYGQHVSTLNGQAINSSGQAYNQGNQMNMPGAYPYPNGNLNPQNYGMGTEVYTRSDGIAPSELKEKYKKEYTMAKLIAIVIVVIMVILAVYFGIKNYEHNKEIKELTGYDANYWW